MRLRDIVLTAVLTAVLTSILNVFVFSWCARRVWNNAKQEMVESVRSKVSDLERDPSSILRRLPTFKKKVVP